VAKALKIGLVIVLAALGAGATALPALTRGRVSQAIQERCQRSLDARCEVGDVQVAMDGVLLREVRVQAHQGRYVARVQRVAVRLGWVNALFGRTQRVDVTADGIDLSGSATVEELVRDLQQQNATEPPSGRGRRIRVRSVRATAVQGRFTLRDGEQTFPLRLEQAGAEWTRDGATTLRWANVGFEHEGAKVRSGGCTLLHGIDAVTSLDCREFEAEMDTSAARSLADAVEHTLAAWRNARPEAQEAGVREAPTAAIPRQFNVRARDGQVRVRHGERLIADLSPASVEATVEGSRVRDVVVRLGGADVAQPSLSVGFNRNHEPWQIDVEAASLPLAQLAPWVPVVPWHRTEAGRAHAHVHVEPLEDAGVIEVSGDASIEDFGLEHRGLAHDPIDGLSVSVSGRTRIDFVRKRVSSPGVSLRVNDIPFSLAGSIEQDERHTAVDASVRLHSVECDGAIRVLPRSVSGTVSALSLNGTIGGTAHLALDTRRLPETVFDFDVQDGCHVLRTGFDLGVRRFTSPFVQRAQEPGGVVRAFVTGPDAPAWVPIELIPPNVLNAVIAREDGGFYRHHGFSPEEFRGALIRNVAAGRFAFGASTISMQLVKNVFLAREKTLVRKLQEIVLTWWLEQVLDKSSILELYLNVVEFGPGIYGIGPASRFFFGREPRDLTPLQAIYLATLLPAPIPRYANFERGNVSPVTLHRLRAYARQMGVARLMSAADADAAQHEAFVFRPARSPVPGPGTLTVPPETTDEQARVIAERESATFRNAAPQPPESDTSGTEGSTETQGDGNTETTAEPPEESPAAP
jgi:hypothetical protein